MIARMGFGLILCLLWSGILHSETFGAGIQNSRWALSSSIFGCRLTHPVPGFGEAVFFHEAGEDLRFFLKAQANPMQPGRAALVVEAPSWRPGAPVERLGFVPVSDGAEVIRVDHRWARRMMASLKAGMAPTFTRKAWYSDDRIRVRLSHVNFTSRIGEFAGCVSSLLPVNFRQVEKTRVYFGSGEAELDEKDRKKLDPVILYVKADPTITGITVDGHASRSGRRIANRTLSKKRAEAVTRYLVEQGLEPERITTRFHGDRYPATEVSDKRGAVDRRATVRLIRDRTDPVGLRARGPDNSGQTDDEPTLEPAG